MPMSPLQPTPGRDRFVRLENNIIDLWETFYRFYGVTPTERQGEYLMMITSAFPIRSRQAAAVAITTARFMHYKA